MKPDVAKLIEEFLELHVERYMEQTLANNKENFSKRQMDEEDELEMSKHWKQSLKYRSYVDKLLKLGYNPYAMGARHVEQLYESGDLKKTIYPDTREIKLELLRDRTKRKNSAEEYEAIVMYKNDNEKGSKNPSSLTGLFGRGK